MTAGPALAQGDHRRRRGRGRGARVPSGRRGVRLFRRWHRRHILYRQPRRGMLHLSRSGQGRLTRTGRRTRIRLIVKLSDFQLNDFHQDCAIPVSLRGSWTPRTVPRLCQNGFRPSFGFLPSFFGFQGCRTCSSLNWADVRAALPARRASGIGNWDQPRHTTCRGQPVWENPHIALSGAFLALRAPDCNGWPRDGLGDNGAIGTQEEPAVFRRNTRALRVLRDSGPVKRKGRSLPHHSPRYATRIGVNASASSHY